MKLVLVLLVGLLVSTSAYAEQKIVFGLESIKYKGFTAEDCQNDCGKYYQSIDIEETTSSGWKILSVTPKELHFNSTENYACTCVGSQYILQKEETTKVDLTQREIKLLKKEIELLKNENTALKVKLTAKKKPSK